MSFSKFLLKNKSIYCIRNSNLSVNKQNFSINYKCFHSLNTLPKTPRFISHKLVVKINPSYRCLSSIKTDTTIDFKPQMDTNVVDLSDAIHTTSLTESATDLPVTALNLASNYTPVGWVLHMLEAINSVLPWWATIAVSTLIFRLCMFPLVIKAQKNAMKMNRVLPQLQELQQKSTNARLSGNQMEFMKYTAQQQQLMAQNDISPFKSMLVPLAQAPVFISFFLSLRRMAQLPVESLKVGGILWFVDLTSPDMYHILPVITSLTLWAALELGVESGVNANQSVVVKTMMRVIPAVTMLFIWNFESAILMYWCSSNLISLLQVLLLKQTVVRTYLGIPQKIKHKPEDLPAQSKSFVASVKESMDNSKIYKKLEERKRIDEINFKRAAIGPIKKTYKTDPTKVESRT